MCNEFEESWIQSAKFSYNTINKLSIYKLKVIVIHKESSLQLIHLFKNDWLKISKLTGKNVANEFSMEFLLFCANLWFFVWFNYCVTFRGDWTIELINMKIKMNKFQSRCDLMGGMWSRKSYEIETLWDWKLFGKYHAKKTFQ